MADSAIKQLDEHNQPANDATAGYQGELSRFVNRELSWLAFNERVLEEAGNKSHPLLERLRFLSISANNLDEFFMVRVAGLRGQVRANVSAVSADGLTPRQQLAAINQRSGELMRDQQAHWRTLRQELRDVGLYVMDVAEITPAEKEWLDGYFLDQIFPVLTPMAIDPAHPFPFIPNQGFAMVLQLKQSSDGKMMKALIPVPNQLPRFVRFPGNDPKNVRFLTLETLVGLYLHRLFPGFELMDRGYFRLIRDSEIEVMEEAEDLVRLFETALKQRRLGTVIRLEVNAEMPEDLLTEIVDADPHAHSCHLPTCWRSCSACSRRSVAARFSAYVSNTASCLPRA